MSLEPTVREQIALQVIAVLVKRFRTFPRESEVYRNAPFHEAFLKAFADKLAPYVREPAILLSLSSWLHGLSTTLGQTFFEKTAQILSGGYKRSFKAGELRITSAQREKIAEIISGLKNGERAPSRLEEDKALREASAKGEEIEANKFTADVFIEDPETRQLIAVEIKSVRPNAGEMRGEKQKILEAKAALFHAYPDYTVQYFIGFPFDPTAERDDPTGMDKARFLEHLVEGKLYFDPDEVLLASEFWDFLSGAKHTMEEILEIINTIATPNFEQEFEFLQDWRNRRKENYFSLLERWGLVTELKVAKRLASFQGNMPKSLQRLATQPPFDEKGNYRLRRAMKIDNFSAKE